MDHTWNKHNFD